MNGIGRPDNLPPITFWWRRNSLFGTKMYLYHYLLVQLEGMESQLAEWRRNVGF